MGERIFSIFRRNFKCNIMKIEVSKSCDIELKFKKSLLNFSDEQKQAIKDINLILECSGLKIYGEIAK